MSQMQLSTVISTSSTLQTIRAGSPLENGNGSDRTRRVSIQNSLGSNQARQSPREDYSERPQTPHTGETEPPQIPESQEESRLSEKVLALPVWTLRTRLYAMLDSTVTQPSPGWGTVATILTFVNVLVTLTSCTGICVESMPPFVQTENAGTEALGTIETASSIFFTVDLVLRFATCPDHKAFVLVPLNIVDFVSLVPFYLDLVNLGNVVPLGSLRVVRLARVFKFARFSVVLQLVFTALGRSGDALLLLALLLCFFLLLFGSLIWVAEQSELEFDTTIGRWYYRDYPESPCPFQSVPACFWWAVVTLCTVGYGDELPISAGGKVVACLCAFCGVLCLAFPTVLLSANFAEVQRQSKFQAQTPKEKSKKQSSLRDVADILKKQKWTFKEKLYCLLDISVHTPSERYEKLANIINKLMLFTITLSLVTYCITTLPQYHQAIELGGTWYTELVRAIEIVIVVIFAVDLIGRFYSCPDRKEFVKQSLNWIDALTTFPAMIEMIVESLGGANHSFLVWFRVLRITRALRALKFSKYNVAMRGVLATLRTSWEALATMAFLFSVSMVIFGSIIFHIEGSASEFDKNDLVWYLKDEYVTIPGIRVASAFQSIPGTFWFVVVTMTTVGYGDAFPLTGLGKLATGVLILLGILILSFPIIFLTNAFHITHVQELEERRALDKRKAIIRRFRRMSESSTATLPKARKRVPRLPFGWMAGKRDTSNDQVVPEQPETPTPDPHSDSVSSGVNVPASNRHPPSLAHATNGTGTSTVLESPTEPYPKNSTVELRPTGQGTLNDKVERERRDILELVENFCQENQEEGKVDLNMLLRFLGACKNY